MSPLKKGDGEGWCRCIHVYGETERKKDRERERERERKRCKQSSPPTDRVHREGAHSSSTPEEVYDGASRDFLDIYIYMCVCVCVCGGERERT